MKLTRTFFVLVLLLGVAAAGYSLFRSRDRAFEAVLEKNEALLAKAADFDSRAVLRALDANRHNGFYFRFDANLHLANASARQGAPLPDPRLVDLDFTGYQQITMGETVVAVVENGLLRFRQSTDVTLLFPASVPRHAIGMFEVRARHTRGRALYLGWSSRQSGDEENSVDIDVIPDGRFHVYRVDARSVLSSGLGRTRGDTIRKIFLCPSDSAEDRVEIDYIRFLSRAHQYHAAPFGTATETRNRELRQVLYAHTPSSLTYRVTVPAGKSTLRFGVALLENQPVVFAVQVAGRTVFQTGLATSDIWRDATVAMDAFAGQEVDITFSTAGTAGAVAFWSNPVLCGEPAGRCNIVLVLEDALRADRLSCSGYARQTTPIKDAWARQGVLFRNAFAQATKTRPSCPSIMTSLYPSTTGVWNFYEHLPAAFLTIAEVLRSQGFLTAAFVQNVNAGPAAGLHQGYSQMFDEFGGDAASLYTERVPAWLRAHNDRNFFLYLHVMDPHGPYNPPESYRRWYHDTAGSAPALEKNTTLFDPDWVNTPSVDGRQALYDGEIAHNDAHFAVLLQQLHDLGIFEDTLVVFLSDHGEHLGEHGQWEHHPPGYVQVIKTPLLMVYPRRLPGGIVIDEPVQNLDIMPTVLELAGIDASTLLLQGECLLPLVRRKQHSFWNRRMVVSEEVYDKEKQDDSPWASIVCGPRHVLTSRTVETVAFNYVTDPDELDPQPLGSAGQRYREFIRQFQALNRRIGQALTRERGEAVRVDPETVQRLKSLGYL